MALRCGVFLRRLIACCMLTVACALSEHGLTCASPCRVCLCVRSIHHELLERGDSHVLLDISHKPRDEVLHHFPNIAAKCAELGLDITQDAIPVLPAQHYTCGGIQVRRCLWS